MSSSMAAYRRRGGESSEPSQWVSACEEAWEQGLGPAGGGGVK